MLCINDKAIALSFMLLAGSLLLLGGCAKERVQKAEHRVSQDVIAVGRYSRLGFQTYIPSGMLNPVFDGNRELYIEYLSSLRVLRLPSEIRPPDEVLSFAEEIERLRELADRYKHLPPPRILTLSSATGTINVDTEIKFIKQE